MADLASIIVLFILLFNGNQTAKAQVPNSQGGLSLGIGSGGFNVEAGEDDVSNIFYPTIGLFYQRRLSDRWSLHLHPNVSLAGNKRIFNQQQNGITEVRSTSGFVNLAVQPKYHPSGGLYVSTGPELAYLLWNYGSSYRGEQRLNRNNETEFFNRLALNAIASVGYSFKVGESRKNAPWQTDVFWFVELRVKKGLTGLLKESMVSSDDNISLFGVEFQTGFSFGKKN